jgi:hypothetical protein
MGSKYSISEWNHTNRKANDSKIEELKNPKRETDGYKKQQ